MKSRHTKVATLAAILFTFGSLAGGANAAILVTISDDGTDLTMTATGSYDFSGVTNYVGGELPVIAAVAPQAAGGIYGWYTTNATRNYIVNYSGSLTGSSGVFSPDSVTTTNPFYFSTDASTISFMDDAFTRGSVNETAVFNGVTLASLGMVAGESVIVTWGDDSATIQTIQTIPEPSSTLLLGLGALGILARRKRTT